MNIIRMCKLECYSLLFTRRSVHTIAEQKSFCRLKSGRPIYIRFGHIHTLYQTYITISTLSARCVHVWPVLFVFWTFFRISFTQFVSNTKCALTHNFRRGKRSTSDVCMYLFVCLSMAQHVCLTRARILSAHKHIHMHTHHRTHIRTFLCIQTRDLFDISLCVCFACMPALISSVWI